MSHYMCKTCFERYDDCKCHEVKKVATKAYDEVVQAARDYEKSMVEAVLPKVETTKDDVKSPSHYALFDDVEAIEIIARSMTVEQFKGYCLGNILKYRLRAGKKSELATMQKDLSKADFYKELFEKHKDKCHV